MNTFRTHRVVMTTIGSLGDLHPYIALALEMKLRYIEPVIAITENYRNGSSRSVSSFTGFDQTCRNQKHQNTVITGFPFFDEKDNASMDPELSRFPDAGPPPIVFTLGSAAVHVAGDFYRESVKAAKLLQRRAVLLVGNDENRPKEPLPEGIAAFNYAPFGELLPRAKALVHLRIVA